MAKKTAAKQAAETGREIIQCSKCQASVLVITATTPAGRQRQITGAGWIVNAAGAAVCAEGHR